MDECLLSGQILTASWVRGEMEGDFACVRAASDQATKTQQKRSETG